MAGSWPESWGPSGTAQAQPPGPGLPRQAPSVKTSGLEWSDVAGTRSTTGSSLTQGLPDVRPPSPILPGSIAPARTSPASVPRLVLSSVASAGLRLRHEQRGDRDGQRRPVGRPGAADPGDPRPLRRVRRHRDRRRRSRSTRARRSGWSPPSSSTGSSSRSRDAASTASASACSASPAPPAHGSTSSRRRARCASSWPPPPARRSTWPRSVGPQRALPRPGRRPVRAAAAQLGRAAHPAARHQQRQGADGLAAAPPSSSDLLGRLPAYTGLTITTQGQAAQAARGASASRGTPSRSTSSRSGSPRSPRRSATRTATSICSMSVSGPTFRLPAERVDDVRAAAGRGGRRALPPARAGGCDECRPDRGTGRAVHTAGLDPIASLDADRAVSPLCFV